MNRQFVSYPKSGRSWIRFCMHEMGVARAVRFHHDSFEFNNANKPSPNYDFARRLKLYSSVDKVIYMHRDPRDILVSLYYQVIGRFDDFFGYRGTISEFIRDDYFGAKNLKIFQDQWDEICARGIACKISYEECHLDFLSVIRKVLSYYDFNIEEALLVRAMLSSRFDNMRQVEESCNFPEPWLRPRNRCLKTRVGKALHYGDSLGEDDLLFLNDFFGVDGR